MNYQPNLHKGATITHNQQEALAEADFVYVKKLVGL